MSIVWYFVALVVLIALSAFFSASEMSYSSANRLRLENAAEDGDRRAKTAVGILDHFDRTLSAILIGNNLVNIAASSLGSVIVILLAGEQWTWVSTVVLTLLVIIFGETMPKIVAKQNANGIALRNAYIIRALSVILYPVIWLVVGLVHLITRPLQATAIPRRPPRRSCSRSSRRPRTRTCSTRTAASCCAPRSTFPTSARARP